MTSSNEPAALTLIDKQANTPLSIWSLSALSLATVPLSARKAPGMPSVIQSLLFSAIYGGAGYVTFVGDHENGAGIATAWCLSWSFLNARTALQSCKPVPLVMVAATSWNILVYGKKTLKANGYL